MGPNPAGSRQPSPATIPEMTPQGCLGPPSEALGSLPKGQAAPKTEDGAAQCRPAPVRSSNSELSARSPLLGIFEMARQSCQNGGASWLTFLQCQHPRGPRPTRGP